MKFNIKKCKTLRINKRIKHKINHVYVMNSPMLDPIPFEEISSHKYLGVILDNKLSFSYRVSHITIKTIILLNLCRLNLNVCDPKVKEIAYISLVRSHLEYASSAWSPHTSLNIDQIENVHRRSSWEIGSSWEIIHCNYGPDSHLS